MKESLIVKVLAFSLVIVLVILIPLMVLYHEQKKELVTPQAWVNEVGHEACLNVTEGIEGLDFFIKGTEGGVIVDFYYKNLNKINHIDRVIFAKRLATLSEIFVLSLASYGIEKDNINCIINVRANKLDKPDISLINNQLAFV